MVMDRWTNLGQIYLLDCVLRTARFFFQLCRSVYFIKTTQFDFLSNNFCVNDSSCKVCTTHPYNMETDTLYIFEQNVVVLKLDGSSVVKEIRVTILYNYMASIVFRTELFPFNGKQIKYTKAYIKKVFFSLHSYVLCM